MISVGCDIIEYVTFCNRIKRYNKHALSLLYTHDEFKLAEDWNDFYLALAICFSGKESWYKVIGGRTNNLCWRDIEILPNKSGAILVRVADHIIETLGFYENVEFVMRWHLIQNYIYTLASMVLADDA